jgi:glycosyltransferase involved in cell wall biosynthesis
VVVGAGPEAVWLRERTNNLAWIHLLGARQGTAKAELLACVDVMLNPGLVGLGILDAFVAGLPMVTTDCGVHSPEIAYLEHGNNGLMTPPDVDSFAAAVIEILDRPTLGARLRLGCAQAAHAFGLEAMIERFSQGVLSWRGSQRMQVATRHRHLR